MKIVHVDDEILSNVPKIMGILESVYGNEAIEMELFATLDDEKKLGFIAKVNELCTFINYEGKCTFFRVDENDKVTTIRKDNYTINFDERPFLVDDNGIEYNVDLVEDEEDEDKYNGYVIYRQYNRNSDVFCDIRFQHMYREINGVARIYPYHTQEIYSVYIDEDFEKSAGLKYGKLPITCKYYGRIKFESDEVGYRMMAICDYGIGEVLRKGAIALLRDNPAIRYSRITRLKRNNEYGDDWPFGEQRTSEYIEKMIKDYGFSKEIPDLLLRLHNEQEPLVPFVEELASEMSRVKKIYNQPENSNLCMKLKLIPDSK